MAKSSTSSSSSTPKKIGLVIKIHQPEAAQMALDMGKYLYDHGVQIFISEESSKTGEDLISTLEAREGKKISRVKVVSKEKLSTQSDVVVVLGGDGTLLSIARMMTKKSIPILGINMGTLGFLTSVRKDEAFDALNEVLGMPVSKLPLSSRALLNVQLIRGKSVAYEGPVVNDVVISKGAIARILGVQVNINGKWVNTVRADGLIIATPTGSTAYSLAAGGPILEPSVPVMEITPICSHSLTHRPIVVSDDSEIELRLTHRPGHVLLTLDGQDAVDMKDGDVVVVKKFKKHALSLVELETRDYFGLLREKFNFGMRA